MLTGCCASAASQYGIEHVSHNLVSFVLSGSMEDSPTAVDCADLNEELDMVSMEGLKPLQTGLSSLFDIDETTIWGWLEPGESFVHICVLEGIACVQQ